MNRSILICATALLLGLGACHRAAAPSSSPSVGPSTPSLPAGVTQAMIAQGDSIYHAPGASCVRCHGGDGEGADNGPSLRSGPWLQADGSFNKIVEVIVTGVPRNQIKVPTHPFPMNPRGGPMNLSDELARSLGAYVWSISRQKTSTD